MFLSGTLCAMMRQSLQGSEGFQRSVSAKLCELGAGRVHLPRFAHHSFAPMKWWRLRCVSNTFLVCSMPFQHKKVEDDVVWDEIACICGPRVLCLHTDDVKTREESVGCGDHAIAA
jgi:hypothetical protein